MPDDVEFSVRTIDETSQPTNAMAGSYDALISKLTELNQSADVTNQYLGSLTESTKETTQTNEEAGLSFSEINQGLEVVTKALGYAKQAYDETIGVSQQYAQTIRDLSQISGESAESTSRFVQVLDDWQVSSEDAMAATKALTKQGLAPNIDTLANLSEKYLSLSSVEDQNAFVTKNLGRAGLEWINVLKQGPDALRAQAAAVSANLILNDKQLQQAEKLRQAEDQLHDTLEGLKITVGTGLTPTFTAWVATIDKIINNTGNARDVLVSFLNPIEGLIRLTRLYGDTYNELAATEGATTKAHEDQKKSLADLEAEQKAADEQAKALSETYTSLLSISMSLQGQQDSYAQGIEDLRAKQADLQGQIEDATVKFGANSEQVQALGDKYNDLGGKIQDLAEANSKAMAKFAYDNLIAKLSVDGLTSSDFATAQQVGVTLGLYTQATANKAIALDKLTSALAAQQITVQQFDQAVQDGTYTTADANANAQKSFDEYGTTVTDASGGMQGSIKDLTETTASASGAVTQSNTTAILSWDATKTLISGDINSLIAKIQEYIDTLGKIPPAVTTKVGTDTGGVGAGAGGASAQGGLPNYPDAAGTGGATIIYNITTAYISADHELSIYG